MVTESGCPRLNQNFQQDRSFIVMLWGQFVQWLSRPATLFDVTIWLAYGLSRFTLWEFHFCFSSKLHTWVSVKPLSWQDLQSAFWLYDDCIALTVRLLNFDRACLAYIIDKDCHCSQFTLPCQYRAGFHCDMVGHQMQLWNWRFQAGGWSYPNGIIRICGTVLSICKGVIKTHKKNITHQKRFGRSTHSWVQDYHQDGKGAGVS